MTVFGRDNVSDDIVNVMGDFTKLALVDIKRDDVSFCAECFEYTERTSGKYLSQ